jgi:hypothetical protein
MGPYRVAKLLSNDNLGLIRISDNKLFTVHKNRVIMARYQDQTNPVDPKIIQKDDTNVNPSTSTVGQSAAPADDDFPLAQPQPAPPAQPAQPAPAQAQPTPPPQPQQQQPIPPQFRPIPDAPPIAVGGHNVRRTPDRDQRRLDQLKNLAKAKRTREQQNLVSDQEQHYRTEHQNTKRHANNPRTSTDTTATSHAQPHNSKVFHPP